MQIELPPDVLRFVTQLISEGRYSSEAEAVVDGLRLLETREQLRRDVDAGVEQLDQGLQIDADEVFRRLEARIDELSESDGAG